MPNSIPRARRFHKNLTVQVLTAILLGVMLGVFSPETARAMKPIGDTFVNLVKMIIGPVIFLTIVLGISSMHDLRKVGRVGGKAFIYFEIVTTFALAIGLVVVNVTRPGAGVNVAALARGDVSAYAAQGKQMGLVDFLIHIVPSSMVDAFAKGDVLQIVFVAVLFGVALAMLGEQGRPLGEFLDRLSRVFFRIVAIIMKVAPIGAFGAMAFTIGTFGLAALLPLGRLMLDVYLTMALFIFIVLNLILRAFGFLDGTSIYLSMATLFIAQAFGVQLTIGHQLELMAVLMLTSKGAAGVTGSGFIVLASTLSALKVVPIEGIALVLGVDRFMSEARAITNLIGNGAATLVIARSEGAFDDAQRARAVTELHVERLAGAA